jgi:phage gp29-like protein
MKTLLTRLFKRPANELAPQLTSWQRQALERPGPPAGGLPYATYTAMESDSMIQTALTLKRLGVLAAPYSIVPASNSPEAKRNQQFIEEAFAQMQGSPSTILDQAMDAFAKGWSVQECVYTQANGRYWLETTRAKDPSLFGLKSDRFGKIEALRLEVPGETRVELPPAKFIVYAHRGGYGREKGRSDLDAAYPHYSAKQTLLAAWKLHLDRFAKPTMMGKFASTVSSNDVDSVLQALQNLASTTAIMVPNDIEVTSIGGDSEASKGYMEAIEFHNREIARAILGQTLTTDEGRRVGSLAMGKVHLQVLVLQLEALRKDLADRVMTEQVIRPLIELNFGPGNVPRFEFDPAILEAFRSGQL